MSNVRISKKEKNRILIRAILLTSLIALSLISLQARAEESTASAPSASSPDGAEQVNVENIKQKYWARGDESEIGVVQNRLYSKANKFELGVFGGFVTTDPFLNVKSTGASLGYHFNEYWSLNVLGWTSFVSPSSALTTFREIMGAETNYNSPKSFIGVEGVASFLYGKLSLVGKKIIYYDMHLSGGSGMTDTESGRYFTPFLGIGQQIYIAKSISVRVDYRLMGYRETIIEKVVPTKIGQPVGVRTNWTNAITIGFDFLFGGGGQ